MLTLSEQLYRENAALQERGYGVITALQDKANATQGELLAFLDSRTPGQVKRVESYWVANMLYMEALPGVILELSERDDVALLDTYHEPQIDIVGDPQPAPESSPNSSEIGLRIVNADLMWIS